MSTRLDLSSWGKSRLKNQAEEGREAVFFLRQKALFCSMALEMVHWIDPDDEDIEGHFCKGGYGLGTNEKRRSWMTREGHG